MPPRTLLALAGLVLAACVAPSAEALLRRRGRETSTRAIYYLDFEAARVMAVDAEMGEPLELVSGVAAVGFLPDGIVADENHIYWGSMGMPTASDGQVRRSNLDGTGITKIIDGPSIELEEGAFTPKQLALSNGKLYWGDREGMRVMRSNTDGTSMETLVQAGTGRSDMNNQSKHCVGVAVDPTRGHLYWTQKGDTHGHGAIFRAGLDIPAGEGPANRTDISVLFGEQPWPVDLDLDLEDRMMYWTDGTAGTVNRASMDSAPACYSSDGCGLQEVLLGGLAEPIGLALDMQAREVCYATLRDPHVGCVALDSPHAGRRIVESTGSLTGVAVVHAR